MTYLEPRTAWWCDGHCIDARSTSEARLECRHLYGFDPEGVRPWTANDQQDLEWRMFCTP